MRSTLLIVEDDPSLRQMLAWSFEDLGYRVIAVSSCLQAREAVDSARFDLALIDCQLPDGNGAELYHELKDRVPHMIAVLSSGTRLQSEVDAAVTFVPKPASAWDVERRFQQLREPARR